MKSRRNSRQPKGDRKPRTLWKRMLFGMARVVIRVTLLLVASAIAVVGMYSHFRRSHDPNMDAINVEISSCQFSGPVHSRLEATLNAVASLSRRSRGALSTASNVERGTRLTERASTEVALRNTGNVDISYIKWECSLFDPKDADRPVTKMTFQTEQQDKPLRPGEVRNFKREFTFRQQLPEGVRSRFRIVRVVYANGDTWQRPDNR